MPPAVIDVAAPATSPSPSPHRFAHISVLALRTHILRDWLDPGWALPEVDADLEPGLPAPDQLL
jgi:hypothetical protein